MVTVTRVYPGVSSGRFPKNWPNGCPPQAAKPASGDVFRIVKADPPAQDDFLTFFELGKRASSKRPCDHLGLSVFRDEQDAASYAAKYPYLGNAIAKATLTKAHGMTEETPRRFDGRTNTHATWWPFEGLIRHTCFAVIKI
jgi:hypothetical protein